MNEHHQPFEEIRHYGTEGQEFWSARELAPLLDYRDWRNFQKVLARATQACEASNQAASDHFVETTKNGCIKLPTPQVSIKQLENSVKITEKK